MRGLQLITTRLSTAALIACAVALPFSEVVAQPALIVPESDAPAATAPRTPFNLHIVASEELLNRFGRPFANAYGWATQAIGNRDPKFSDIEQAVDLEHWRPHYKFASHNVHANSKGILSKLGLYRGRPELLLAGPSVMGFTDHGHGTAVSLLQITMSLLTTKPNIDRLCVCTILSTLAGEIGETFLSIQKGQEKA